MAVLLVQTEMEPLEAEDAVTAVTIPSPLTIAESITEQLEAGKRFFGQKYKDMQYIAYFQSYSCTYAPIDVLRQKYEEALSAGVKGLVIGTRPDCLQEEVPDLLEEFKA